MAERDFKVFIVEGEAREPLIIDNIYKIFFTHANIKIITLPAGQNIYMLWKKLKEDDFDTDIIEVLRESNKEIKEQLTGLGRDNFSEVYLFFDYDGHQNNLANDNDEKNILEQMLISFNNETENGKLYISYPMVEAVRDFEPEVCGNKNSCFITIDEFEKYKDVSAEHAVYPHFKKYTFEMWKEAIDVYSMRISCLMKQFEIIDYEQYREKINPFELFRMEEKYIQKNKVFILSAFPEFLLDYFGEKLWKKCVKHTTNLFKKLKCKKV